MSPRHKAWICSTVCAMMFGSAATVMFLELFVGLGLGPWIYATLPILAGTSILGPAFGDIATEHRP